MAITTHTQTQKPQLIHPLGHEEPRPEGVRASISRGLENPASSTFSEPEGAEPASHCLEETTYPYPFELEEETSSYTISKPKDHESTSHALEDIRSQPRNAISSPFPQQENNVSSTFIGPEDSIFPWLEDTSSSAGSKFDYPPPSILHTLENTDSAYISGPDNSHHSGDMISSGLEDAAGSKFDDPPFSILHTLENTDSSNISGPDNSHHSGDSIPSELEDATYSTPKEEHTTTNISVPKEPTDSSISGPYNSYHSGDSISCGLEDAAYSAPKEEHTTTSSIPAPKELTDSSISGPDNSYHPSNCIPSELKDAAYSTPKEEHIAASSIPAPKEPAGSGISGPDNSYHSGDSIPSGQEHATWSPPKEEHTTTSSIPAPKEFTDSSISGPDSNSISPGLEDAACLTPKEEYTTTSSIPVPKEPINSCISGPDSDSISSGLEDAACSTPKEEHTTTSSIPTPKEPTDSSISGPDSDSISPGLEDTACSTPKEEHTTTSSIPAPKEFIDSSISGPDSDSIEEHTTTPSIPVLNEPTTSSASSPTIIPGPTREQEAKARQILAIINSYSISYATTSSTTDEDSPFLAPTIAQITSNQSIKMIIPAFPMKSPNRTAKVLSTLPDLGEELALHHLNGLCSNIQDIYPPGAEVRVQSDGLVYSDLLGVSDGDVFDYGEALRDMARTSNLSHLKFSRVSELLGYSDLDLEDKDDVKVRRARYLDQVSKVREDLLEKYKDPDLDIKVAIRGEEDTRLTYCGYLKFLATDLVDDPRVVEARKVSNKAVDRLVAQVAREMLVRGKAFAEAIRERLPGVLRLSIHEGVGSSKISVGLIPVPRREVLDANSGSDGEGDSECICSGVVEKVKLKKGARLGPTPWHSVIAVGLDGSYRSLPAQEVKPTHDLIYQHGRPYYYREKSDLFNWPFPVTFSPQYPCGLIISPDLAPNTDASSTSSPASPSPSLAQIPMSKVRALATTFSPIILRGFQDTLQEDLFVSKAEEMGTICPWNFGIIQKVKDLGQEKNETTSNVTTNEAMPFHYDGVFKFENRTLPDGTTSRVSCPPLYQLFTCHANTVPRGQGTTLFASSRLLLQYFPPHYPLSRLRDVTWTLRSQGFWSATLENLNLIVDHPVDNQPCLRWHEPWDSTQSHIATSTVKIENDEQDVSDQIKRLIYDRRICVYFTWEKGDALVNDNFAMHHTRTRYDVGWERELWRIHVD